MVTLFRILQWIALISGESWDAVGMTWSLLPPPVSWLSRLTPMVKNVTWGKFLPSLGFCFMVPNPQGCCKDSSLIPLRLVRGRGPVSPWGLAGCSALTLFVHRSPESGIFDRKDHQDSRLSGKSVMSQALEQGSETLSIPANWTIASCH